MRNFATTTAALPPNPGRVPAAFSRRAVAFREAKAALAAAEEAKVIYLSKSQISVQLCRSSCVVHPASSTGVSHSSGHSFASEEIYGGNNCIVSILRLHEFCVNDIFMNKLTKYDMLIMEAFFVIPLFNSSLKRLPFALRIPSIPSIPFSPSETMSSLQDNHQLWQQSEKTCQSASALPVRSCHPSLRLLPCPAVASCLAPQPGAGPCGL